MRDNAPYLCVAERRTPRCWVPAPLTAFGLLGSHDGGMTIEAVTATLLASGIGVLGALLGVLLGPLVTAKQDRRRAREDQLTEAEATLLRELNRCRLAFLLWRVQSNAEQIPSEQFGSAVGPATDAYYILEMLGTEAVVTAAREALLLLARYPDEVTPATQKELQNELNNACREVAVAMRTRHGRRPLPPMPAVESRPRP